eukprot:2074543-Prymnesium_polylepis.2
MGATDACMARSWWRRVSGRADPRRAKRRRESGARSAPCTHARMHACTHAHYTTHASSLHSCALHPAHLCPHCLLYTSPSPRDAHES